MESSAVYLNHLAYCLPTHYLTSDAIEAELTQVYEKLHLPPGRLEWQTGIRRRGYWPLGTRPSSIATEAAAKLLTDVPTEQVDLLIHSSVCRDFLEPATASVIHQNLKLSSQTLFFDLSNACLGFMNALDVASHFIRTGKAKTALVVTGENSAPLLFNTMALLKEKKDLTKNDMRKHMASLTIGSAGVAAIVSAQEQGAKLGVATSGSLTEGVSYCQGTGNLEELTMETDSEHLLQAGISLLKNVWKQSSQETAWNLEKLKVIGHQVGRIHEEQVLKALGLWEKRGLVSYPEFGNTGSAALPLTLALEADKGTMNKGDQLALIGVGSGLSSSIMELTW